jgi:protein ImuB
LSAVNEAARRLGLREGQTIAEAGALTSKLVVRTVKKTEILGVLGRVAEALLAFGTSVSIEAPDTIWVDVTGVSHLVGGEASLASELYATVSAFGYAARVCISQGPRLAQALARWAPPGQHERVVARSEVQSVLAELPITALPLAPDRVAWFARLGVLTVGQLSTLPGAAVAARLGEQASAVLGLCRGTDSEPLSRYEPPQRVIEQISWEESIAGLEPLLFALRGLVARLSARLVGRGQAAQRLRLVVEHDRSIAELHRRSRQTSFEVTFAAPLWQEQDLLRALRARLEQERWGAPSTGMRLEVSALTEALARQLDLSRLAGPGSGFGDEATLPVLLSELEADVGVDRVGILRLFDTHRPEAKSALVPLRLSRQAALSQRVKGRERHRKPRGGLRKTWPPAPDLTLAPTRLLTRPLRVGVPFEAGALLSMDQRLYSLEKLTFEQRLEDVEWWTESKVARDYLRLVLGNPDGKLEALAFVERSTGQRYLYAIAD